jgi:pre-mRNA-splicing factor SYF1
MNSIAAFEEDVLRNPYSVKSWLHYIDFYGGDVRQSASQRFKLYERALALLPRSYKLWFRYLAERVHLSRGVPVAPLSNGNPSRELTEAELEAENADPEEEESSNASFLPQIAQFKRIIGEEDTRIQMRVLEKRLKHFEDTIQAFERCLNFLPTMPLLWLEYADFLWLQKRISATRRVYDRALQALPVTQHMMIWEKYIEFVHEVPPPAIDVVVMKVYPRYLQINPGAKEEYIEHLKKIERFDEASRLLIEILEDEKYVSKLGKSTDELWTDLCSILCKRSVTIMPNKQQVIDVEAVMRTAIERYPTECGKLWNSLSEYYIREGLFEKARDIHEEALKFVSTAKDFHIVFTAYAQLEESMVSIKLEAAGEDDFDFDADDVDLRLFRLEHLMNRRAFLLNEVLLRQNPHNIEEWLNRVDLFKSSSPNELEKIVDVFSKAVLTVEPDNVSNGKLSKLWLEFAKFYEEHQSLDNARIIFEKAVNVEFKGVDEHATIWCSWAEFEIRHENYDEALSMLRNVCVVPSKKELQEAFARKGGLSARQRLYKSTKLWALFADLEESLGTFDSAKAVYDQILSLKIATPQIVLNYVSFLQEHKYFEESFRVFEKSLSLFVYPHNVPLWSTYLEMFVKRYGKTKIDRARELFEDAIKSIPSHVDELKGFFILYADVEEQYGLARNALRIYDRSCDMVPTQHQFEMYQIYIAKAGEFFGIVRTREIFEKAIHNLPEAVIKTIAIQYAALELKLGEVERARAVYTYAAQFCNPKRETVFWQTWEEFETNYGNEDSFRDMLRLKRSVEADFENKQFIELAAEVDAHQREKQEAESRKRKRQEEEAALSEHKATRPRRNAEELDLSEDEQDDEDMIEIEQQAIPAAVFNGISAES